MTLAITFASVLVLLAVIDVALVLLISSLRKDVASLRGTAATFERRFVNTAIKLGELSKATPANLAAEVVALSDAVSRLRQTQQRFAGRFDQYVGRERAERSVSVADDDDDVAAILRLQSAPPVSPGNGGL